MRASKVLVLAFLFSALVGPAELRAQTDNPATTFAAGPVRWWNDTIPGPAKTDKQVSADQLATTEDRIFEITTLGITSTVVADGSTDWSISHDVDSFSSSTFIDLAEGRLIATVNDRISAYDPANGELLWEIRSEAPVGATNGAGKFAEPSFADGMLFTNVFDVELDSFAMYAIELDSGATKWRAAIGPLQIYQVPLQDHRLFVATSDGYTTALDTTDGAILWRRVTNGSGIFAPAVTSDVVVVTMREGEQLGLVGLDAATGDEVYRLPGASLLDSTDDSIALVSLEDEFFLADADSGASRWTIPESDVTDATIGDQVLVKQWVDGIPLLSAHDPANGTTLWETLGHTVSFWPIGENLFRVQSDRLQLINAVSGDLLYELPMNVAPAIAEVSDDLVAISGIEGSLILLDTSQNPSTTGEVILPGIKREAVVVVPDEPELFAGIWQLTVAPFNSYPVPELGESFVYSVESGEALIKPSGSASENQADQTLLRWVDGETVSNTGPSPLIVWFAGLAPAGSSVGTGGGPTGSFQLVAGFPLDKPESDLVALTIAGRVIEPGTTTMPEVLLMPAGLDASGEEVQFSSGSNIASPGAFSSIANSGTDEAQVTTLSLAPAVGDRPIPGGSCYGRCLVS